MPARRFIYLLLIALAVTTTVFIGNFSTESFSTSSQNIYTNIRRRRDGKDEIWHLRRRPSSVTTRINSSAINAVGDVRGDNNCVNLSLIRKTSNNAAPLPLSVVDGVKTFVFFIGIGRSGHSIVASILDSHPHMVVSNELNLFKLLNTTLCAAEDKSAFLFNQIWNKSYTQANTNLKDSSKGYSYISNRCMDCIKAPMYYTLMSLVTRCSGGFRGVAKGAIAPPLLPSQEI